MAKLSAAAYRKRYGKAPPKEGVRDPKSHKTPAQRRKEGRTYQATEDRKKYRAGLNKVNRTKGEKGDGKDVCHKKSHKSGGKATSSNTRLCSPSKNRASAKKRK